ncbi:MAG: hypothetical protein II008_07670 [Oscillospiraceae bacterium]|nr:hypothetical protein [Oscillospiraceae bacterium]
MTGTQREAIDIMKMMESVTVNSDLIAQALGMNPGVLRKHVRDGDYHISAYEVCNDRIRFFRRDFLQKIGEMPPDMPERTVVQAIDDLREELHDIGLVLLSQLSIGPAERLLELKEKEKAAGAGTPTD